VVKWPVLITVLMCAAWSCARSADDSGFAGVWVLSLEGRPLMVLTLESDGDRFEGTLKHPVRITSDGRTFSNLGGEATTDTVTTDPPRESSLRITTIETSGDKNEMDLTLTAPGEGQLAVVGAPFKPWPLRRHTGSGSPQVWTGWDAKRSYAVEEPYVEPNAEMAEIYKADQAVRQSMESFAANAKKIEQEDAARRERTRALLDTGALKAADDFRLAALVFQHGTDPRDYLFAHTLALVALAKGDRGAAWIASASLDRYLQSVGQSQIFGAAFGPGGKSQGAFDRGLVSDELRRELGVPALAEQEAQMQQLLRQITRP
jgi:hypothetical protein